MNQLQAEIDALAAAVLYVFDGDGVSIGRYGEGSPGDVQVFDEANGVMLSINSNGQLSVPIVQIFFESTDYSGTSYFHHLWPRL